VIDQSLAIMLWALGHRDPQAWLPPSPLPSPAAAADDWALIQQLIAQNDGPFKHHLDRFRYPERFLSEPGSAEPLDPEADPPQPLAHNAIGLAAAPCGGARAAGPGAAAARIAAWRLEHRQAALAILHEWNARLRSSPWLVGPRPCLADIALLPFVRQFQLADPPGFAAEAELQPLRHWLARLLAWPLLAEVMEAPWGPRSSWHSPRWLYHLALVEEWRAAQAAGVYRRSSRGLALEQVGFVHACQAHQLAATHQRFYADLPAASVRLLSIDPDRLAQHGVPVRFEPAPDTGELFPHLYGALPVQAVLLAEPYRPPDAPSAAPARQIGGGATAGSPLSSRGRGEARRRQPDPQERR
jgi:glutathione S-transferase